MNFAHVENGALVRFLTELPFTFVGVERVRSLTAAQQAALGLLPVVDVTPAFDSQVQRLAQVRPAIAVFADRVEVTRQTEPVPDAEINERAARKVLQDDARAAELRDKLRAATPAEISTYVDAQVTDLPSARLMFKRVLLVLALMSRS